MKKLLTVLCSFLLALSIVSFGTDKTAEADTYIFPDVVYTKYADAVCFLHNNGIVSGTSNATYSPNQQVTRADFVVMLYRMAGSPAVSGSMPFTDVTTGAYYYKAVLWAYRKGITAGTSSTTFSPNAHVTYQEIFTFIHTFSTKIVGRASAVKTTYSLSKPSNLGSYSAWAKTHVTWAYNNGIVYGVITNNLFTPTGKATRGDVALFLYNYYQSFQKRFALIVGNNKEASQGGTGRVSSKNTECIRNCFSQLGFSKTKEESSVSYKSVLDGYFDEMFGESTCIDICCVYLHSHGDTTGMLLFYGKNNTDTTKYLKPYQLYNYTTKYKGFFVIMIEACYSGVFIDYFKVRSNRRVSILTSADSNNEAIQHGEHGLATKQWADYITSRTKTNRFVSLYDVWIGTKPEINKINAQNPSFYSYCQDYVAFTKKFNN